MRNFVEVISNVRREELVTLLEIYQTYPKSLMPKERESVIGKFNEWLSDVDYYEDNLSELQLKELLYSKIKKSYKAAEKDDLHAIADDLVRNVAKKFEVHFDELMSSVELENEIFRKESQDKLPLYRLTLMSLCYLVKSRKLSFFERIKSLMFRFLRWLRVFKHRDDESIRIGIIRNLFDAFQVTTAHRKELGPILLSSRIELEQIAHTAADMRRNKNFDFKASTRPILGMAWLLILTAEHSRQEEIDAFNALKETFGIGDREANEIKANTGKTFEDIRNQIISDPGFRDKRLNPNALKTMASGTAGSLAVLSPAEAAGFGLFLFATTTLHAIGLLIGTTFAFSTYTALTTVLGCLTGPIGWVGIPILVSGGILAYRYFKEPEYLRLRQTIVKSVLLRGGI